ncbi:MAG: SMC-Scp complex subunit ScpB [Methanobacteriota archaeon]|nr:SMC-Scp complex subunit ScpB [Candidatus Hydrothermarchaeota archaeon]
MKIEQLIEAALFLSMDPISIEELCRISGAAKEEIRNAVELLKNSYESRESAVEIRRIGGDSYLMQVKDIFATPLLGLVKPAVSQEVLKTLSLIALKQPVTQAEVVKSRGYSTYAHVKELVNKGFIFAAPAGRTKLLTTTQKFADYFGFPPQIEKLKKAIGEQLKQKY